MKNNKVNSQFIVYSNLLMNKYFLNLNSIFLIILLNIFLINIFQINAQSLDSLINEALSNNPLLKSLGYKIKSSENKINTVNTLPAPTIGFDLNQLPFSSLNWLNGPLSQNLSFSQMFMLGGKLNAMSNVEKANVEINRDNLEIYKVNLIANIKMIYYNLWLFNKKIEIQQEGINLLNQLLKSVESLFESNKISQADIFTIKSEIAIDETQLLILNKQKETEIYKINNALGRNLDSKSLYIVDSLTIIPFNYSQAELENMLTEYNPSLKRMNSMINMTKIDIIANKKELNPDLMLSAMFMRMPKGMIITSNTPLDNIKAMGGADYGYSLMASITLPYAPWSKSKIDAKEQELQMDILSSESELNDMNRNMLSQLKTAFVKMTTSWDLINLYNENVIPLYIKARESQIISYQNNQTNINTVIDANRMLLMQSMNYYMAQADYKMAQAEIEMMVGALLNK